MFDIKLVKLASGEEIIAEYHELDDKSVKLNKPAALVITQNGAMLAKYPIVPVDEDFIIVKSEHIVYNIKVGVEILNAYNKQFGSGIVIADNNNFKV